MAMVRTPGAGEIDFRRDGNRVHINEFYDS
jgi:hypothetical protein